MIPEIRDNANQQLYGNNQEAQDIWRVTQAEFNELTAAAHRIFDNTRVSLADERGIEIWERIFGILPDLQLDTLEDRRERILEMMRMQPPFTERWLSFELFRRTNDDTISAFVVGLTVTLQIKVPLDVPGEAFFQRRVIRELMLWMRHVLPANVMLAFKTIFADIDIINGSMLNFSVEHGAYNIQNLPLSITRPLWNGEINWDGTYTWTPEAIGHRLGFVNVQHGAYNLPSNGNVVTASVGIEKGIRWDGTAIFDGEYDFDAIFTLEEL